MKLFVHAHNGTTLMSAIELDQDTPVPRVGESLSLPKHADGTITSFVVTDVTWSLEGKRFAAAISCVAKEVPEEWRLKVLRDYGWLPKAPA
jgi:hypothetical protein